MGYTRKRLIQERLVLTGCSVAVLVFLFPILFLVSVSIKPIEQIMSPTFVVLFEPTAYHYKYLFTGPQPVLGFLVNSILIAALTAGVVLPTGSMAAYAFSRIGHPRSPGLMFWMITTRLVPPVAFAIPLYIIIKNLGLLDTKAAVVLGHSVYCLPLVVWIMKNYFDEMPSELEEAAQLDGCSVLGAFLKVALPIAKPGLVAAGTLTLSTSISEFFLALVFTGTRAKPLSVGLISFLATHTLDWGRMAAGSIVLVIPGLLVGLFAQRYLVSGLTAGAIK